MQDNPTIILLSNASGNGVSVKTGSKFTLDFAGYNYTITGPTLAGSSGTKTQCFQLLRDSELVFKNGSIIADNSSLKLMIQNYANLTLTDMTLDATQGDNAVNYVVSNNCGDVLINGSTSIIAKENGYAFDVYYWPTGSYTGGVRVTVNTTGVIKGNIEVESDGSAWVNNSNLTVKNGKFNGSITNGTSVPQSAVTIFGGIYVNEPKDAYIAEHYKVYNNPDEKTKVEYPYTVSISKYAVNFSMNGHGTQIGNQSVAYGDTAARPEKSDRRGIYIRRLVHR